MAGKRRKKSRGDAFLCMGIENMLQEGFSDQQVIEYFQTLFLKEYPAKKRKALLEALREEEEAIRKMERR